MDASKLTRFRADPTKVRVSIRRCRDGEYRATVKSRNDDDSFASVGKRLDPNEAVMLALGGAESHVLGNAYDHPFR